MVTRQTTPRKKAGLTSPIKGMHALFYSPKADELRSFIRDKLGLKYTDTGGG
ncbi:MAG TPA: hypothetical protein VE177_04135 [Candidatus Binatus sp.]|nr:hypothetical protein [Candidatus Binatus sp.]